MGPFKARLGNGHTHRGRAKTEIFGSSQALAIAQWKADTKIFKKTLKSEFLVNNVSHFFK